MTQPATAPVLTTRALNRATLERQLLLRRAQMTPLRAVEHLVGLQAQAPTPPYYALAARLAGFRPQQLSQELQARRAVRISVMRSTIHLVSAEDALVLRPLTRSVHERTLRGSFGRQLAGVDVDRLTERARELVQERPLTPARLGELLQQEWPRHERWPLAMAARQLLPLVQVTPRALWGRSATAAHTTVEAWLGREEASAPDVAPVLLRYLAAFGPASVKDMQIWSGLTRLREVIDVLRPRLRTFRDERGVELFDLPDAPLPDPETEAPVRFLSEFDNVCLSYADRARIVDPAHADRTAHKNVSYRVLLLDGFVAGLWRVESGKGTAVLTVELFGKVPAARRTALEAEAATVLETAAPGASWDIRYAPVHAAAGKSV